MNTNKMKAIVCQKYGSPEVLELQEVAKPTPKNNQVLVKVHAASVTAADGMMRKGSPYIGRLFMGLRKPKYPITGTSFSGEVEAIGKDVTRFNIGDHIFGESLFGHGTNAEYTCVAEDGIVVLKPESLSFEEAAGICDGGVTSMNFLKNLADIKQGQKVLIIGASGSLGTAAVQLAKHFGAEVTGVCSTPNVDLVKSIGADQVIDYKKMDFRNNGQTYDIIYDTVGKSSFSESKDSLTEKGLYLSPVGGLGLIFQIIKTSILGGKKAKFDATGTRPVEELQSLLKEVREIMVAGKLKTIIDRKYQLSQTAEAHRYVETGRKKGNVVLSIS